VKSDGGSGDAACDATGLRIAIVAGRYYADLVDRMVADARACIEESGGSDDRVDVFSVAGAFEVPQLVGALLEESRSGGRRYDAVIGLGVLIRGETPHFEYISSAVAHQLCRLGVDHGVPVAFGIITANTVDQAVVRAGGAGDGTGKGREAAYAAVDLANRLVEARSVSAFGAGR
jgi:6,7-dimethyl-8-ribityllumazine synthase